MPTHRADADAATLDNDQDDSKVSSSPSDIKISFSSVSTFSSSSSTGSSSSSSPGPASPSSPYSDAEGWISRLHSHELLKVTEIRQLCNLVKPILLSEKNVLELHTPLTMVGDVHGQFNDVLEMFLVGGPAPHTNYLFLGDYVDRGSASIETISLILCLKLRYPNRVHLIRGNHECRTISRSYGFYAECNQKYGDATVWSLITDVFDYLPLSAVVDDCLFAIHGGIAPSLQIMDSLRIIDRFQEIPFEGAMCDGIWSDPDDSHSGFRLSTRGAGYTFGRDVFDKFLYLNRLSFVARAHQLCQDGYSVLWDRIATVWSAPNYCGRCGNLASILECYSSDSMHFNIYDQHTG